MLIPTANDLLALRAHHSSKVDLITIVTVAAFAVALLTAIASIWRWRVRRAAEGCQQIRSALERLGNGKAGLLVKELGAFNDQGLKARQDLADSLTLINDKRLKELVTEFLKAYDDAEKLAIGRSKALSTDTLAFKMAAIKFDPGHPSNKSAELAKEILGRLSSLERRASGL